MDKSNGYEKIASRFIELRGKATDGIGAATVRKWARTLPPGASILDLGCGTGLPITKVLVEEGMRVYAIDASPTLLRAFRQNFPSVPARRESVAESSFFDLQYGAVIAIGLMFLLPPTEQGAMIQKAADHLRTGGKLLFTAPRVKTEWKDVLTGEQSVSLGAERYKTVLSEAGLSLLAEFEDEGGNYYFDAVKE
ncbi:class I SAM-dependent methyltransferase [Neolewinella aquimaris]|nr:class I SAM-dependent methyltransferase [Neolewinella aquimaris]